MAWTGTNPSTIGNPTKKSDYDKMWDNLLYLKAEFEQGHFDATGAHREEQIPGMRSYFFAITF